MTTTGELHHVELWVPDIARATASLGWLLEAMGYELSQEFANGRSWQLGATYITMECSPAMSAPEHDRMRPGLNHLAFHIDTSQTLDALVEQASGHGWRLMFADKHPYAGGPDYYAAYLEDADGFEVELVASRVSD